MVIYWETPEFISAYQDGGYDVFLKVKDEWRDVAALGVADVARETYSGAVIADTLSFKTPIDAGGVKVVLALRLGAGRQGRRATLRPLRQSRAFG